MQVDLFFVETNPWMARSVVLRAAVVDVFLAGRLLDDRLPGDDGVAVFALNQTTGVGEFMGTVDLLPQQHLHRVPSHPINQRLVRAGMPLPLVLHFPDVRPIPKDGVELASSEARHRICVVDALLIEALKKAIEGQMMISVQFKELGDFCAVHGMNLHKTTFVNSDISITVRSFLREQTFFDPPLHATFHVD
ncbi:MAG: hypothetical protein NTW75_06200 [Planctomycetales bacterium]|nr:hypothetical protein [Planctomycetales bacterium]